MSKQFDNNMSGALFKNDRKEKDTHPDYKGQCEVKGVQYWISAWLKDSPQKGKYMSLSFTPKDSKGAVAEPSQSRRSQDDFRDSIPF